MHIKLGTSPVVMLNKTRIGVDCIKFHRRGPCGSIYVFLMLKSRNLYIFLCLVVTLVNLVITLGN